LLFLKASLTGFISGSIAIDRRLFEPLA